MLFLIHNIYALAKRTNLFTGQSTYLQIFSCFSLGCLEILRKLLDEVPSNWMSMCQGIRMFVYNLDKNTICIMKQHFTLVCAIVLRYIFKWQLSEKQKYIEARIHNSEVM